jgi:hypothetical protein
LETIGVGNTTVTETISGTVTTFTTEVDVTQTNVITTNFAGGDGPNNWYNTAKPPCVCVDEMSCIAVVRLADKALQCYSCTIAASTIEVFYWQTRMILSVIKFCNVADIWPSRSYQQHRHVVCV